MAAERNHFNINLGDTIYSDSEVGGHKPALTVAGEVGEVPQNLGFAATAQPRAAARARTATGTTTSSSTTSAAPRTGSRSTRAGVKAFTDYAPVRTGADGLYRTFRWGKHLELFFLDERSFRSAKAVAAICNWPAKSTSRPRRRQRCGNAFARSCPRWRPPVPQACLDAHRGPRADDARRSPAHRASEGDQASTATLKVIVNEVPLMQFFALAVRPLGGLRRRAEKLLELPAEA